MGKCFSLTSSALAFRIQEGVTALHPSKWDTRKQTSDFALPWAASRSSTALPAFHSLKSDVEGGARIRVWYWMDRNGGLLVDPGHSRSTILSISILLAILPF